MVWGMGLPGEDDRYGGIFQCFCVEIGDKKARGAWQGTAAREILGIRPGYGAIFFIVGINPMCGLPTGPWALLMLIVAWDVLPQQSFFGQ